MTLLSLEAERFRGLAPLATSFDGRYNLIVGPNASGKTSVLEALFFLGRGRSFRSRRVEALVRHGASDFRLVGRVSCDGIPTVLGIQAARGGTEIRIGGTPARSASELATHFPPHVIDPEIHKLLEEGPAQRRRFVDWGVFHVEPSFLGDWQRYHRVLRQRNAALRTAQGVALSAWDREFTVAGIRLADVRDSYLALLAPHLARTGRALLDMDVTVAHQRGWPAAEALEDTLRRSSERDRRFGISHVGPHRADLAIRVDGQPVRDRVSRGQQKLLASALTLAQLALLEGIAPGRTALLLDDPAAELDGERLERLVALVRSFPVQLFVTSLRGDLQGLGTPGRRFHVEHGQLVNA